MGGSFSYPVTEGFSVNSTVHLSETSNAVEIGSRVFLFGKVPFLANMMMTDSLGFGVSARLSGSIRRASLTGSYEYFEANRKEDVQRFSNNKSRFTGSMIFSPAKKQRLIFSVRQDFGLGSFSEAVDYRRRWALAQHQNHKYLFSMEIVYRNVIQGVTF